MGIIDRWREIGADAASALVRALAYAKGEQVVEAIDRALWEEPEAAEAALLTALTNPDANVREAAAQAVGRLGVVKAVDPLLKNVQDPQKQGCLAEIEALAALHETAKGHPQAVPALLDVLRDQENRYGSERRAAAHALGLLVGKKNTQAVQTLLEVLYGEKRDRHWEVRYEVVVALGELRATSAIDSLIAKSRGNEKGESYHVQRAAVEALGKLRNSQATSSLINAAVDASDDIRYAAVKALASLKSENVLSMLTYHLKDHAPKVRQATAEALGELGHLYALKPLSDALETEKTSAVRVAIVEALRAYPHRTDAAAVLRSTLEDDTPAVKAAAAEGLGLMKPDNRNVHSLIKALKEKDYAVKEAAIRSLGKLKVTQAASKLLKELTRMRRWQTRFWTAVALSEIGEESIAEDLRKVLEEKDSDAAFAAAVVLAGLGENTDRVKKELLSALTDPRIEARCIAAAALGKLKDAETLPALLREMRNQNDAVRESIADAIRGMGDDERVKTALDDLLQHPFQGVRQTARMAQKG